MTVEDMLHFLSAAEKKGRLLIKDSTTSRSRVVKSMSIRIDDDGETFIIMHDDRAAELADVAANTK